MRKLLLAGLMGCLLVGSIPTGGRTDEPKALKRILDSALKAMGGEANLAKARAAHWRATGTYYAPGGPVSFTGEWWMQPPEQMKVVLEAGGPSKLSRVTLLDGNRGWITAGGNTQEMNEDQLAQAREELYHHEVTSLWSLRDPAFRLEMAGETKIEDRPAAGIKVTHAGHADITLYFDRLDREGRLDAWFDAASRLLDPSHVVFTGHLEHNALCHLYPCCDVALFPSIVAEAGPLVLIEAMASGCYPMGTYFAGMGANLDIAASALDSQQGEYMRLSRDPEHLVEDIAANVVGALGLNGSCRSALREVAVAHRQRSVLGTAHHGGRRASWQIAAGELDGHHSLRW